MNTKRLDKEECDALLGDMDSVLEVVKALREYRKAAKKLLGERYRDGAVDGVSIYSFANTILEIEEDPESDGY